MTIQSIYIFSVNQNNFEWDQWVWIIHNRTKWGRDHWTFVSLLVLLTDWATCCTFGGLLADCCKDWGICIGGTPCSCCVGGGRISRFIACWFCWCGGGPRNRWCWCCWFCDQGMWLLLLFIWKQTTDVVGYREQKDGTSWCSNQCIMTFRSVRHQTLRCQHIYYSLENIILINNYNLRVDCLFKWYTNTIVYISSFLFSFSPSI